MEVFDDWFAAGPEADDCWRSYEKAKGHTYPEALKGYAANHVFDFDLHHLKRVDGAVLVYPAGKSAHLELGYVAGQGKPTFILLDQEPDRFDVMLQFATGGIYYTVEELIASLLSWTDARNQKKQLPGISPILKSLADRAERSIQPSREGGREAWHERFQLTDRIQCGLKGDLRVGRGDSNDARMGAVARGGNRAEGGEIPWVEGYVSHGTSADILKEPDKYI